jgi:hypothetical protein
MAGDGWRSECSYVGVLLARMNVDAKIEEGCSCSFAAVYELALHSGSCVDRSSCHSDGCPFRQLLCLKSRRLRRRIESESLPGGLVGEVSDRAAYLRFSCLLVWFSSDLRFTYHWR